MRKLRGIDLKKEMNMFRMIQILAISVAVIGVLSIFPGRMFHTKDVLSVETTEYQKTPVITEEENVMQQLIPSREQLHSITVMVDSLGGNTGLFKLRLYDQALNLLWEDGRRFDVSPGIANFTFTVNQKLEVGQPYYYTLNYDSASFAACYTQVDPTVGSDNGMLYFNLQEIPNSTLITS